MARQADGVARIENLAPHGGVIVLLLKRVDPERVPAANNSEPEQIEQEVPRTVLVADDDPDVRQFLTDSL